MKDDETVLSIVDRGREDRARRVAKRAGFQARKSRSRRSLDNHGGFMLVDPDRNAIVAGSRFELTPEDVIERCGGYELSTAR